MSLPPTANLVLEKTTDPISYRLRRKHDFQYPPFSRTFIKHECLNSVTLPRIRANCIYIRTYKPEGFTRSGLFIDPKKGPPIWGHILAVPAEIRRYSHIELIPGDMILFHRYAQDDILQVGNLTLSIVHIEAIQSLFSPPLVEFRA